MRHGLVSTLAAVLLLALPARGQDGQEIPLGSTMPMIDTALSTVHGGQSALGSLEGQQATVVMFWSNQCPWVERYEDRFIELVNAFAGQGVSFVLVNSNDSEAYPQEANGASAARMDDAGYPSSVSYLSDPSSELARAFGAERTPHVYVFDDQRALVYVGTIDDSPGDPANVQQQFLRRSLDSIVGGSQVAVPQSKAFGCTIKFSS